MSDTRTRVYSLSYLAEMVGGDTTITQAKVVRDALIAAMHLSWTWDDEGGHLDGDLDDDEFHRIATEAIDADTERRLRKRLDHRSTLDWELMIGKQRHPETPGETLDAVLGILLCEAFTVLDAEERFDLAATITKKILADRLGT